MKQGPIYFDLIAQKGLRAIQEQRQARKAKRKTKKK